jgi:hypothetical protein
MRGPRARRGSNTDGMVGHRQAPLVVGQPSQDPGGSTLSHPIDEAA